MQKKQPTVKSIFSELFCKITGVIAEHGFKDVQELMQKSSWYWEFELGREAERQLKRGNGRDKSLRQDLTLLNITGLGNVRQCYSFTKTPKKCHPQSITSRFPSKIELLVV